VSATIVKNGSAASGPNQQTNGLFGKIVAQPSGDNDQVMQE